MTDGRRRLQRETLYVRRMASAVLALGAAFAIGGCHLMVNPFADELAKETPVMTPSARQALAAEVTPSVSRRDYNLAFIEPHAGSVTHGPFYFEDPFESGGSEDGRFAWDAEDYFYLVYGPSRFLINGLFFPVSVVITPPYFVMASDGHIEDSRWRGSHDAVRTYPWLERLSERIDERLIRKFEYERPEPPEGEPVAPETGSS